MNYEALGRYTDARERMKRLRGERAQAASIITMLVLDAKNLGDSNFITFLQMDRLQEAMRSLEQKDIELQRVVSEVNDAAGQCGRSLIQIT